MELFIQNRMGRFYILFCASNEFLVFEIQLCFIFFFLIFISTQVICIFRMVFISQGAAGGTPIERGFLLTTVATPRTVDLRADCTHMARSQFVMVVITII